MSMKKFDVEKYFLQSKKVFPYIDIVLLFLHFLVLWGYRVQHLFETE